MDDLHLAGGKTQSRDFRTNGTVKLDKIFISPYNITPESCIKVERIEKIITNERSP